MNLPQRNNYTDIRGGARGKPSIGRNKKSKDKSVKVKEVLDDEAEGKHLIVRSNY